MANVPLMPLCITMIRSWICVPLVDLFDTAYPGLRKMRWLSFLGTWEYHNREVLKPRSGPAYLKVRASGLSSISQTSAIRVLLPSNHHIHTIGTSDGLYSYLRFKGNSSITRTQKRNQSTEWRCAKWERASNKELSFNSGCCNSLTHKAGAL